MHRFIGIPTTTATKHKKKPTTSRYKNVAVTFFSLPKIRQKTFEAKGKVK